MAAGIRTGSLTNPHKINPTKMAQLRQRDALLIAGATVVAAAMTATVIAHEIVAATGTIAWAATTAALVCSGIGIALIAIALVGLLFHAYRRYQRADTVATKLNALQASQAKLAKAELAAKRAQESTQMVENPSIMSRWFSPSAQQQ